MIKDAYYWFAEKCLFEYREGFTFWGHVGYVLLLLLILVMAALLIGLIVCGIYSLLDYIGSKWENSQGIVIDHQYKPSSSSTGVGVIANGQGGVSPVVTSSSSPEAYLLYVRESGTGTVYKFDIGMQSYFDHQDGLKVSFKKRIGRISHSVISKELL